MSRRAANNDYPPNGAVTAYPTPRPVPNSLSGVPYVDANEDAGEIPLDQIDSFVVPAQDQNHVSESVHFRIPPYLKRYAKILVSSGRFPYLDIEDLIRHAILRHITWLCSIRTTLPFHIRIGLAQQAEVCADDEMRMQVEQAFARTEERIKYHMARGDQAEVIRLLNMVKQRMDQVHTSARMREWKERFEKSYGQYLAAHRIAQLTNSAGVQ